jgi:hypothetical protein
VEKEAEWGWLWGEQGQSQVRFLSVHIKICDQLASRLMCHGDILSQRQLDTDNLVFCWRVG